MSPRRTDPTPPTPPPPTIDVPRSAWTPPVVLGGVMAIIGVALLVWQFVADRMTGPGLTGAIALAVFGAWMVDPPRTLGAMREARDVAREWAPRFGYTPSAVSDLPERAGRRETDPVAVSDEAARVLADSGLMAVPRAVAAARRRGQARRQEAAPPKKRAPRKRAAKPAPETPYRPEEA